MGRVDRPSETFFRTTTTCSLATSATYDARPSEAGWNAADAGCETPRDIWLVHLPLCGFWKWLAAAARRRRCSRGPEMWFCFLVPSAAVISTIMWEQGVGVAGGQ